MKTTHYEVLFKELRKINIKVNPIIDNEDVIPTWTFHINFNEHTNPAEYDNFLENLFINFTSEINENILPMLSNGQQPSLDEIYNNFNFLNELIQAQKQYVLDYNSLEQYGINIEIKDKELYQISELQGQEIKFIIPFLEIRIFFVRRILNFIKNITKQIEYPARIVKEAQPNGLVWNGTSTELIELVNSLVQSRIIGKKDGELTRKEALQIFSILFGKELKHAESLLSKSVHDSNYDAPFLDKLKKDYVGHLNRQKKSKK